MPLNDIADVTRSLTRLLKLNMERLDSISPDPPGLTVTPDPPEDIESSVLNTLSLHLYHVGEDPHYKNLPGPGIDPPNVATNPMGLCLYYILTAHHGAGDEPSYNALIQQKLMGLALKTFHDNPVITERTEAGDPPELVWPEDPTHALSHLRDDSNQIEVILRPVSPDDAMAFWGNEERQTTRLSAYYEVRVMFLEPEPPKRVPGTVLEVGQFVFQLRTPSLDSSRSHMRFTVPGPDGGTRTSEVRSQARVTLNSELDPPPEHNRLELLGKNLTAGISRTVLLSTPLWNAEYPVDPSLPANPNWEVLFGTDVVDIVMAPKLNAEGADRPVRPGIYIARIEAVVEEQVVAGELRQITVSSNAVAFAVAPRIIRADQPDPDDANLIRVVVGGEFSLTDTELEGKAIEIIIDGIPYQRVTDPPANPRQFSLRDDMSVSNAIRLNPHADLANPGRHPFRLIVNGAESAPFWIEVP